MSFLILYFTLLLTYCNCLQIQNLGGKWSLKEASGKYVDLEATVPGGIYTDLMNNGIIGDVFFGFNDNTTKWVPRLNWTYYTNFTVDEELLKSENINLVFDGLDTFANVYVNNENVGETQNMFVQYIFDIKKRLKIGENKIEVRFLSPIEVAENLDTEQKKSYNIPLNCPPDEYNGECHVNMIRKMQASFSWDWGPSFPSVGIWKDVYIEAYHVSTIRYVAVDTTENNNSWVLNIDTYFAGNAHQEVEGDVLYELRLTTVNITRRIPVAQTINEYNEIVLSSIVEFSKDYAVPWWPNGYGAQDLYDLIVTFTPKSATEVSTKTVRVGFRTIELVQDTISSGLTFYFKVNGVPIFMKGSNEIPIDILPEKGQNKTIIKRLLTDAYDAHMNMLRVWGGGVYESDYFYDLADELGILIWQDFMFACSLYPVNENYLSTVVDEVRHQVKRLRSHASIAIFSGNNENEGVLRDNWYGTQNNFEQYKSDYVKLYIDTIRTEFLRLTHDRGLFVSSSPSNGKETEEEGYVAEQPSSTFYGDVHYYNYVFDSFDSNIYPVPRFASEYGYQSLPSFESLLSVTDNASDIDINSDFMNHRQHHPSGNGQMQMLIDYQFTLPATNSSNYSKAFIYYSQILHALSIKIETEHYRRYRGILNDKGQGNTMGALYWQLNDVWIAPTWSGIDYNGKWKMLQYYANEFFSPIIITGHMNIERTLEIYVVSDLLSPVFNVTATIETYKWDSLEAVFSEDVTIDLEAGKSHLIDSFNIDDYLSDKGCGSLSDAKNNCVIYFSLHKKGFDIAPDNFILPNKVKDSNVKQPNVQIETVKEISSEEYIYEIGITTNEIALFVWLDAGKIRGKFSENGFILVSANRTLYFYSEQSTTEEELQGALTITNLLDPQYFVE
ncbi:hypothetical protein NQ318_014162 [Aromia moschata]|uniref:beta-mannosidase n=1 Tax=Aromia moschata TaxID=1265417 RepID=A0AAV8Y9Z2_9CUCU|nr:hypothetical protein NQ318_014162 [Aromia moschata]